MMTARQYRARAGLMDKAVQAASNEAVMRECKLMAGEWRRLASLADWQDSMLEKGHPA